MCKEGQKINRLSMLVEKMRWHPLSPVFIVLLLAPNTIMAYATADPDNSSGQASPAEIDDSGFRPDINGFSFQNYGDDPSIVDLTHVEMQRMFGDKVCASKADGKCVLTYPAKRWMDEAIKAMGYGHCEGIAVLSDLIYYSQVSPGRFGGNNTIELSLQNEPLQREIGYWWVTQVTNPGGSNKVYESPNSVLDVLVKAFGDGQNATEWWVMGIYQPDGTGGHAITPFAVEDMGNGTSRIQVYDNNWPKESRFVEVNRSSNSWRYVASINPNEPAEVYVGNASTQGLEIVSVSSRLGLQECDFCSEDNGSSLNNSKGALKGKNIQIWQDGKASTFVTDEQGRRAGVLESGKFVNEIPDAEIRNLRFGFGDNHPPVIFVPIQSGSAPHINATINGMNSSESSNENNSETNKVDIAIIAPGLAVASSVPDLEQGQQQSIDLAPAEDGYDVSFRCNRALSPTISLDTDYQEITVSGINIEPSGIVSVSMNPIEGTLDMRTVGNVNPGTLRLQLTSLDQKSGESYTFHSLGLSLRPNDGISLSFADSENKFGIPSLSVSHENGDTERVLLVLRDVSGETYLGPFESIINNILSSPELDGVDFRGSFTMQETRETQAPPSISIPQRR
jgi:hypothetical protein